MSHATSTPSYNSSHHHSPRYGGRSNSVAVPMAIPGARSPAPPPPLPPPRHISPEDLRQDTAWQFANNPNSSAYAGQYNGIIKADSSLLGGASGLPSREKTTITPNDRLDDVPSRRASNFTSRSSPPEMFDNDEDNTNGARRLSVASHRLQTSAQLDREALQRSSNAYDKQLLSKIGGPNTPIPTGQLKQKAQLPSLAMPDRPANNIPSALQSPGASRWPSSGAVSPGQGGLTSPMFDPISPEGAHPRRFNNTYEEGLGLTAKLASTYDQGMFVADYTMEGTDDASKAGSKRRASSPHVEATRDDRPTGNSGNDLYHRRSQQMLGQRSSPVSVSRLHSGHPVAGTSLASTASTTFSQRMGSLGSSYGASVASSATSYSSERLSPSNALSPADPELGPGSPYADSRSLNVSPRGSFSRTHNGPSLIQQQQTQPPRHARNISQEGLVHSRHNSVSKMQGPLICKCCSKKPKKFDNIEDLRNHESEKQYTCTWCSNRFKNKNEMERHQNSLHLRRHSWCCAALAGVPAAFHPSSSHSGSADVCGYCGEEFPNPPNWDVRGEHLNDKHKFGECNQSKKFFRADHFRQHLKHTHAGTSGKWTNMLENACMKNEPPPKEGLPSANIGSTTPAGITRMNSINGVINEVHDES